MVHVRTTVAGRPWLLERVHATFHDGMEPLRSDRYDAHLLPGGQKRGLLIGIGMTEKQGGSDVLSNTTHAERLADE